MNKVNCICESCNERSCLWPICEQRMPRSDCALAQSDLGLRCPLRESLDTTEYTDVLFKK